MLIPVLIHFVTLDSVPLTRWADPLQVRVIKSVIVSQYDGTVDYHHLSKKDKGAQAHHLACVNHSLRGTPVRRPAQNCFCVPGPFFCLLSLLSTHSAFCKLACVNRSLLGTPVHRPAQNCFCVPGPFFCLLSLFSTHSAFCRVCAQTFSLSLDFSSSRTLGCSLLASGTEPKNEFSPSGSGSSRRRRSHA